MKNNSLEKANSQRNILITGGAGYIGSNIVAKLCHEGYNCVIVDNFSNSYPQTIEKLVNAYPTNIKVYHQDILDSAGMERIMEQEAIDVIMHMAGKKYVGESFDKTDEYYSHNVVATMNLLHSMEKLGINKFVFSSSITVYGDCGKEYVDETTPLHPLSPYAMQKMECEEEIAHWRERSHGCAIVLRLSNPVGADTQYMLGDNSKNKGQQGVVPFMINRVLSGEPLFINGCDHPTKDGTTVRDYVHVQDVATAFTLATKYVIEESDFMHIFNCGSSKPGYSVKDIICEISNVLDKKVDYSVGPRRAGDVSIFLSDISAISSTLHFAPTRNLHEMVQTHYEFHTHLLEPLMPPKDDITIKDNITI